MCGLICVGCQHMWRLSPGHSRVTHSSEPDGHSRSPKDTKAAPFEFRRRLWQPEEHLRARHRHVRDRGPRVHAPAPDQSELEFAFPDLNSALTESLTVFSGARLISMAPT